MKAFYSSCSYLLAFLLAAIISPVVIAQTPMFSKGGSTSTQTIPLNQSSQKTQIIYAPGDMTPVPVSGQISKIYFRNTVAASSATYTNFKVSFTQTTATTFADNTYLNNLFVAKYEPSVSVSGNGAVGGWFEIPLNTPFQYDASKSLVVEIEYSASTGGISTYSNSVSGVNRRISGTSLTSPTGTLSSTWNDFGFDVDAAANCTNPPSTGTLVSNAASPICPGNTAKLFVNLGPVGSGITYTWQSSSSATGTFTDIAPASAVNAVNVNPSVTTFYRAAISCNGGAPVFTTPVGVVVKQPLSGVYTINSANPTDVADGGTNFQNFTDAASFLNCGTITGPVTFNVAPGSGPYTDQFALGVISGTSPTSRIIINGNDVTINASPVSATRHFIRLDGTDYVTIKRLNLVTPSGATYGWGVQLTNGADNNLIDSCTIDISTVTSTTQSTSAGIVMSGSTSSVTTETAGSYNVISNNIIKGAYQGVIFSSSAGSKANVITKNIIQDFYSNGITIINNDSTVIRHNDISRPTRAAVTTYYGIEVGAGNKNLRVDGNRMHDTHTMATSQTGAAYGVYVSGADAPAGSENRIYNNLVYNFNSATGAQYGLYNSGADGAYYYHNTVALTNGSSTSGLARAFYQTTEASNVQVKNNILYLTRGGSGEKTAIYLATATSAVTSNYNNIFVNAPSGANNIGYAASVAYTTLGNWQTATSQDVNSNTIDPQLINPSNGDLKPTANALNNLGTFVGVTIDIDSVVRNTTNPDMGAYEFDAGACSTPPAGGQAYVSNATNPVCAGYAVTLDLQNIVPGLGQTYTWQSSTTATGTYTNIAAASGNPTIIISATSTLYYRAAVTCSGNTSYSDPVLVTVNAPLAGGTYTINAAQPTGGTNFQSFNDAVLAISCGVTSSTVFNVQPGTSYNEQVIIPSIPGASASNTITFNGNGADLSFTATDNMQRATLKFNGADYVIIDSLNINALGSSASEYGFAVQFINDADNNIIRNSTINATTTPATASSQNFAGIVISGVPSSATAGASDCDSNIIVNNLINGGYYGITVIGNTARFATGNKISNNIIKDFYQYGAYLVNTDSLIFEKNNISRPARTTTTNFYAVYVSGATTRLLISKNLIHDPFKANLAGSNGSFGIYLTGAAATAGKENMVVNNLLYDFKSGGAVTGIWHDGASNTRYYHNTISFDDQTSPATSTTLSTQGIVVLSVGSLLEFKNNIVTLTRNDNTPKRAINIATSTTTGIISDNNVLYVNAPGVNRIGAISSTEYATLADWQAAAGGAFDQQSKSVNPAYENPTVVNYKPTVASINNMGASVGVATDILDSARLLSSPDPGAYEFFNDPCTAPATPGVAILSNTAAVCPGTELTLNLNGQSVGTGITYQWQSASTLTGSYTAVSGILTNPLYSFVAPSATMYYRAAVTCSGVTSYSDTVQVTVPVPVSGTFTINSGIATGGTNFQTFADAINHIRCGISGPVVFNVEAATSYNEQVQIPAIPGTSSVNTITINGNGATITTTGVTGDRGAFTFNGADHVIVDSLNINISGSYGYGVVITNNADSNVYRKSSITTISSSTSTFFAGVAFTGATNTASAGLTGSGNVIENNTITGGYYGIVIYGNNVSGGNSRGNILRNNQLVDQYSYGVYGAYQTGAVISNNVITRPTRSATPTTLYGIYLTNGIVNTLVEGNRISNMFGAHMASTSEFRGIYISSDSATAGNENKFINNMIFNTNGSGIVTGIYNTGSEYNNIYHNTIVIDGSASNAGAAYGFYQTNAATGINFSNNIVYITRSTTGNVFGIFRNTSTSAIVSNNNVIYLNTGGSNQYVGYYIANRATLTDWRTATGQDMASKDEDPLFFDLSTGDLRPTATTIDNMGAALGVTHDANGVARNMSTPDVGALEFGVPLPVTGISLAASRSGVNVNLSWVTLTETNNLRFEVQRSFDGSTFSGIGSVASKAANGNSSNAINYRFTDANAFGGNIYYRLKQWDKDGRFTYSNVALVQSTLNQLVIGAVYPNPVAQVANVVITSPAAAKVTVIVADVTGKVLTTQHKNIVAGNNNVSINVSGLATGTYFIRFVCDKGCDSSSRKFVK